MTSNRDDFSAKTKADLDKRSGFHCAICNAITIGPSADSPQSVSNVGVAAHISAAAPRGRRYKPSMAQCERVCITNGIWLCQTHAKLIDTDETTWSIERLIELKHRHESWVQRSLGVPISLDSSSPPEDETSKKRQEGIRPREYAFIHVGALIPECKSVLKPMLDDWELSDDVELGILMSGDPELNGKAPWTTFVNAEWLRWLLRGQKSGFGFSGEIPSKFIYGRIPAWPDTFFEFLAAIVMTEATFVWKRTEGGFLCLSQALNRASAEPECS